VPRVSVIVPTFERAELCIRAVRSALAQTLPPLEVLVWDDGSDAATRERLGAFAALHAQVRLHEGAHAGTPAVGRNRLIERARGGWVAMLDDDDEWLPDKLERQHAYMEEWDVIGSGARLRSDDSLYLPHVGAVSRSMLQLDNVLVLSTVMFRRSLVTRGFREQPEFAGIADYCLWLDLADAGARIVATSEVVAIYDDGQHGRLSDAGAAAQLQLARLMFRRWQARVADVGAARGAAVYASRAAKLRARSLLRR
jgi:glycosyltransferase involved in cell wall biosynthesis